MSNKRFKFTFSDSNLNVIKGECKIEVSTSDDDTNLLIVAHDKNYKSVPDSVDNFTRKILEVKIITDLSEASKISKKYGRELTPSEASQIVSTLLRNPRCRKLKESDLHEGLMVTYINPSTGSIINKVITGINGKTIIYDTYFDDGYIRRNSGDGVKQFLVDNVIIY